MRRLVLIIMLAVLGLGTIGFSSAPSASAETRRCTGRIGASTVDNITVPAGKSCTLERTRVKGSVWVSKGGTLRIVSAKIEGNVQSEGFNYVRISGSTTVKGSVQLKKGGIFSIDSARVDGNIQTSYTNGKSKIARNIVNGDIQVNAHKGGVSIGSSRVDGNLQCKSNSPAPTGSKNVVEGNKENQCRRL
ncbi:MAG: hypothetical protein M3Y37_10725 [Chloroflexota bacterium]|nr:hypothetical protein [Chloroflexota bacterium]